MQQAVEQNVLAAAKHVEEQLDDQLHALENLDSDDIDQLRQKRLLQLKVHNRKKQEWQDKGHGQYNEILGEKEFFKEIKGEDRLVCHFYRENWPCKVCTYGTAKSSRPYSPTTTFSYQSEDSSYLQVMDKHLKAIAASHLETKFIKVESSVLGMGISAGLCEAHLLLGP